MKKFYLLLALCLMFAMNIHAVEVTVYDGKQKNDWAPFALSYGNGWTESQYVIPESELGELFDKTITGVKYYCDGMSAFTSFMSVNFLMWEEPNSVTSLNGFRSAKAGFVGYNGHVSFVMNNGVCETTITFNKPLVYVGGSLVFHNWSDPAAKNNVSFYGKNVSGACWAGNNEEMGGVMENVGQRNFAPKTTFICEDEPLDEREVVTSIELEGFDRSVLKAGEVIEDLFVFSSLAPVDDYVPYDINLGTSDLYKYIEQYNGYEQLEFPATITAGEYAVSLYLVISGGNIDFYRFPDTREAEEAPTVTVDGQEWTVEYSFVAETYSGCYIKSPNIRVYGQGIESVQQAALNCKKTIKNGQLLIIRGDKTFNAQGAEVK